MANLKVVIDSPYVNCDFSFDMEVDDEEYLEVINNLHANGFSEDRDDALMAKFEDDAWDVIRNNLEWHIEVEDEDE